MLCSKIVVLFLDMCMYMKKFERNMCDFSELSYAFARFFARFACAFAKIQIERLKY